MMYALTRVAIVTIAVYCLIGILAILLEYANMVAVLAVFFGIVGWSVWISERNDERDYARSMGRDPDDKKE